MSESLVDKIQTILISTMLLGMKHSNTEINASDIPSVSYENAVSYLKTKVPLSKAEWNDLNTKVRFRAFTVAKLTNIDLIEEAKKQIVKTLETGGTYATAWENINAMSDTPFNLKPGYWENIYRTNTSSAYSAAKLMAFEKTNPVGIQLFVIDDERTTDICKRLLHEAGSGIVLSVDHPFWQKYGYPPYHYQCRTGIRGVYKSQIDSGDIVVQNPKMQFFDNFNTQQGFGGNPIEKESWWRMTKSMAMRAAKYDIFNDIESYAKENGLFNFSLDLVNGSDYRRLEKTTYKAEKAGRAEPLQKEVAVAKILEDNGHSIYFTPENTTRNTKNPDVIVDGKVAEIKVIESLKTRTIKNRLKECDKQKAQIACLQINNFFNHETLIKEIKKELLDLQSVNIVYLIYESSVEIIKK